ncbi:MAG: hypothetical protein MMC33_007793 [Icmadophila ericetorum]|nr:hypothetical protein [Icmadophila ericetorum]
MAPRKRTSLPKVPLSESHPKLRRLPDHATIQKRPIHHPSLPSPHNSSTYQKLVYISSSTPFISAVKRIHKLLGLAEKRDKQRLLRATETTTKEDVEREERRLRAEVEKKKGIAAVGERVYVRGTGKAMRKVEDLGVYFEGLVGFGVERRTGRVGVVDDVVVAEGDGTGGEEGLGKKKKKKKKGKKGKGHVDDGGEKMDVDEKADGKVEEKKSKDSELPETRIRYLPMLEVAIGLKKAV